MSTLSALYASGGFINFANPGATEMIIVLAVVLIFFGPKRLPALARSVGRSITDFKKGLHDIKGDIENAADEAEKTNSDAAAAPAAPAKKEDATAAHGAESH